MNLNINKINFNNILDQPKENVSSLTNDDIELLLMETILAYIDTKINLKL